MNRTTTIKQPLMPLIQVREKAQITLPSKIRKVFGIKEGDYLEPKVRKDGILLSPKAIFDKTFLDKLPTATLSKKGEQMLKEGLKDIEKGRVEKFEAQRIKAKKNKAKPTKKSKAKLDNNDKDYSPKTLKEMLKQVTKDADSKTASKSSKTEK